jgi:hypothetical protein
MKTLSQQLVDATPNTNSADLGWTQFVMDHRSEIIRNSDRIEVTPEIARKGDYHIGRLVGLMGGRAEYGWIVMEINNIRRKRDIRDITKLYIPPHNYMTSLYAKYKSSLTRD